MIATCDQDVAVSEMIEAHARHLRAEGKSARTIKDRVRVLHTLHKALPFGLAYASTDELTDWLARDEDWAPWTKATYAMHIRGFYRWATGRWLAVDPTDGMAKPRIPKCVPHPVTDDELAIALGRSGDPWRPAIILAAFAGLRASEAADVHKEDVTERTIRIRAAKGGDAATVDTHPIVWELVQEGRPTGPLVRRADGRAVDGRWLSQHGRAHFNSIGLPSVHLHRFRHWYGTTLLKGGHDLRTVQEAMRHRSITSTQGYTLIEGGQRRLAIRSLPTPTQDPQEH
jgi:integrase